MPAALRLASPGPEATKCALWDKSGASPLECPLSQVTNSAYANNYITCFVAIAILLLPLWGPLTHCSFTLFQAVLLTVSISFKPWHPRSTLLSSLCASWPWNCAHCNRLPSSIHLYCDCLLQVHFWTLLLHRLFFASGINVIQFLGMLLWSNPLTLQMMKWSHFSYF